MWHSPDAKGWDHTEAIEEAGSQPLTTPWCKTEEDLVGRVASSRASLGQLDVSSFFFPSLPPHLSPSLPPLRFLSLPQGKPHTFMETPLTFFKCKHIIQDKRKTEKKPLWLPRGEPQFTS